MIKIMCHSVCQKAEFFEIKPTKYSIKKEFVLYLKKCVICNKPVLEIVRIDSFGELLKPVRLRSKNMETFLKSMVIIRRMKKLKVVPTSGFSGFVLDYNEFGKRKKCSQNFSNLQLGRIETDPYLNLRVYKNNKYNFKEAG